MTSIAAGRRHHKPCKTLASRLRAFPGSDDCLSSAQENVGLPIELLELRTAGASSLPLTRTSIYTHIASTGFDRSRFQLALSVDRKPDAQCGPSPLVYTATVDICSALLARALASSCNYSASDYNPRVVEVMSHESIATTQQNYQP